MFHKKCLLVFIFFIEFIVVYILLYSCCISLYTPADVYVLMNIIKNVAKKNTITPRVLQWTCWLNSYTQTKCIKIHECTCSFWLVCCFILYTYTRCSAGCSFLFCRFETNEWTLCDENLVDNEMNLLYNIGTSYIL